MAFPIQTLLRGSIAPRDPRKFVREESTQDIVRTLSEGFGVSRKEFLDRFSIGANLTGAPLRQKLRDAGLINSSDFTVTRPEFRKAQRKVKRLQSLESLRRDAFFGAVSQNRTSLLSPSRRSAPQSASSSLLSPTETSRAGGLLSRRSLG